MATPSWGQRVRGYLALARPGNVLMAATGALVGALVAAGLQAAWLPVALAAGATGLVTAGGNALNDVTDREIDRRAHPERPIPTGLVSPRGAIAGAAFAFVLAIGLAAWVSWPLVGLVAAAEALLIGYEGLWKTRGLAGNVVVAALVGATFLAGGLAVGSLTAPVGFLAGLAFLANVAREVWKDAEDADHDVDRTTFARRHGETPARRLAQAVTVGAVALSVLPLLVGFGGWVFALLVGVADAVFLAAVFARSADRAQRLSKGAMLVALVAFALGGVL